MRNDMETIYIGSAGPIDDTLSSIRESLMHILSILHWSEIIERHSIEDRIEHIETFGNDDETIGADRMCI